MGTLWQDIKYGSRILVRNPGFAFVVVVILGIGIGATTAMLSLGDAVLWRPPPYEDPDGLVYLYATKRATGSQSTTSCPNVIDWQNQNTVFEQVAGECNWGPVRAVIGAQQERIWGRLVSREFFPMLRVRPLLGRTFLPEDDTPGGGRVVIISYHSWRDWFGGDVGVIGKTIVLDKQVHTVIGVLPPDFRHATTEEHFVWVPLSYLPPEARANRKYLCMAAMARLKPGVSLAQAREQMRIIGRRLEQEYPATNSGVGVSVVPLVEKYRQQMGRHRQGFWVAQGVVALVLLIACLHVASLLLIRWTTREREIIIRAALGAERLRLVRQLLTESLLLAGMGGVLGLLLAYWGMALVSALRSGPASGYVGAQVKEWIPWFVALRLDSRTFAYVLGISLLTYALFAVVPALGVSKTNFSPALSLGRTPGGSLASGRVRSVLVAVDVALAFVLLIGAGLLVNSYVRILNIEPGYHVRNVLCASIALDEAEPPYSQPERRLQFFRRVLEHAGRLPGVVSVTAASDTPVQGTGNHRAIKIEGFAPGDYGPRFSGWEKYLPDKDHFFVRHRQIFPNHFRVFEIPVLRGRDFTEQDTQASSPVVIINESMAQHFWPNEDAVGKYLIDSGATLRLIVGVVGNERHFRPDSRPGEPEVYVPYAQSDCTGTMCLLVRTGFDPARLATSLRDTISAVDPGAFIDSITRMEDSIEDFFAPQRFAMASLSVFAAVALFLASVGVYGVTAYSVAQRTQEIGIRMALGAGSGAVLKAVLRQGFTLTFLGLALGVAGALAATRVIRSLLYEVSPTDPLTFVCVGLLLAGVALLASYLPARRAARIDPMVALRYE